MSSDDDMMSTASALSRTGSMRGVSPIKADEPGYEGTLFYAL